MITLREVLNGIDAALGLALLQPEARRDFDASARGFWLSFSAIWIVAPTWLWIIVQQPGRMLEIAEQHRFVYVPPPMGAYLAVEAVFYVIAWTALPLLMQPLSQRMKVAHNYARFVVARNWGAVLMWFALTCPTALLFGIGVIDYPSIWSVSLIVVAIKNAYLWYIAKVVLDVNGWMAGLVVAVDVILFIVMETASRLIYSAV